LSQSDIVGGYLQKREKTTSGEIRKIPAERRRGSVTV